MKKFTTILPILLHLSLCAENYKAPNISRFKFKVENFPERQSIARELYLTERNFAFAEKAIAIALLLDPDHKQSKALNVALSHSLPFDGISKYDSTTLAATLAKKAALLSFNDTANELSLAWYLNYISKNYSGLPKHSRRNSKNITKVKTNNFRHCLCTAKGGGAFTFRVAAIMVYKTLTDTLIT